MQGFLEFVVKGLVQHPGEVTVTPVDKGGTTIYELRLNPGDVGRVIGKHGRTAAALRTLAATAGEKDGKTVTLEFRDGKP